MKAIIKKVFNLKDMEEITITLRDGHQFTITEGHGSLVVNPGVECEVRRYDRLAWEVAPKNDPS